MTILGIDPGNEQSALVHLENGVILGKAYLYNDDVPGVIRAFHVDLVAIERIASYGMPVGREVFETCFWTGRFWQTAVDMGFKVDLIERLKVKQHLCHDSRAKDGNIRQALIDRFGPPGTKKNPGGTYGISGDVWAALAVVVTAYDKAVS